MIKLYDSQVTDVLPEVLAKEPETQALAYAIRQAMRRLITYANRTSVYSAIDEIPEDALNLLAVELQAQYYEEDLDIEIKRSIVKKALEWHRKAGTHGCVQDVIETVFGSGRVIPWHMDETGELEPGYFDIEVGGRLTDDETYDKFQQIVEAAKNESSHLRRIVLTGDMETDPKAASAALELVSQMLTDDVTIDSTEEPAHVNGYMAITDSAETEETIYCAVANVAAESSMDCLVAPGIALLSSQILMQTDHAYDLDSSCFTALGIVSEGGQTLMETDREAELDTAAYTADGMTQASETVIGDET